MGSIGVNGVYRVFKSLIWYLMFVEIIELFICYDFLSGYVVFYFWNKFIKCILG